MILGPITLGAGESEDYIGSFVVTTCGRPITTCVTAVGMDICQDRTVTSKACCAAARAQCEGGSELVIGGNGAPAATFESGVFSMSFMSKAGANYIVQYKVSFMVPVGLICGSWLALEASSQ